jgi:hypothetical protein
MFVRICSPASGTFDATADGIDFYESMEAMRVQLNDAVTVGPSSAFGEIPVVGDGGSAPASGPPVAGWSCARTTSTPSGSTSTTCLPRRRS